MKEVLLGLVKRWFTSEELLAIFFALAEEYVKSTDNTMDDVLLASLKAAFQNKQP
jgi:hypothetical protein